ncbi:MAG TPA: NUDIX hydrolase [Verrucomicrobiota bacterium]|nr:NUDIX hydrolase [Verrucomicrobiota bacterium]HNU52873.1 NUDIX hydrolase [Verrucomicrobiota bacterium]
MTDPQWLDWCRRLQAIAQNGLCFARDPHDVERYTAIREIAAGMLSRGSGLDVALVRGVLEKETGYATPKVDVRGVVFRGDQLLLVRERAEGRWTLPGGWADPCESPAESVEREIREESGFVTRASQILAVLDRSKHPHEPPFAFHVYKIFMRCFIIGGSECLSQETDAVGFFGEANLPELSISRVTPQQIRRLFEHHRNPALPADFD